MKKSNQMKIVTDFSDESLSLESKTLNTSSVSLPNTPNSDTSSPRIKHARTRSSTDPNVIPLDLISSFQAHPWFSNAEETFPNDLIQVIHIRNFSIGDTIIKEGTKAKAMFFIIKGIVEVTSEDDEIVYAELGKGCFFGEIGVLFQVARTSSVVAKTKCIIASINASEFYELCEKHPKVAKAIHDEAIDRYTDLKTQKEERGKQLKVSINENMFSPLKSVSSDEDLLKSSTSNIKRMSIMNINSESRNSNSSLLSNGIETTNNNSNETNKSNNETADESSEMSVDSSLKNTTTEEDIHTPKLTVNNDSSDSLLDSSMKVVEQNTPSLQNPNLGFIQRYSGRRRASVAVWADDQLSKLQQNIQNQLNNKEKSPTGLNAPSNLSVPSTTSIISPINNAFKNENSSNISSETSSIYSSISSVSKEKESSIYNDKQNMDSNIYTGLLDNANSFLKKKISKMSEIKKVEEQPYLGPLPIDLMKKCISFLDFKNQFRIRRISKIFNIIITNGNSSDITDPKWIDYDLNPPLSTTIDLSTFPKLINDNVLKTILSACGDGIIEDLSLHRCWGVTDVGCKAIEDIGSEIRNLNLLGCWDITDNGLISLSSNLPNLEFIDLSNCRKITNLGIITLLQNCPKLSKISLSYCKNLSSDLFANSLIWRKVTQLNLQRCTGIFDAGFAFWKDQLNKEKDDSSIPDSFHLKKLNLSDCSFLTDAAINSIADSCIELEEISLSFCCALTDECILNLLKKCKELKILDLNYCGLAVTDEICDVIANECKNLNALGFRGCVQITDEGIKTLINSKSKLKKINCSQCSNITNESKKLLQDKGI
jgi:CRP-like cAMP-binding protein